eukprot:4204022-Amphidinium_carterae.1
MSMTTRTMTSMSSRQRSKKSTTRYRRQRCSQKYSSQTTRHNSSKISRPSGKQQKLKAQFAAKGYTEKSQPGRDLCCDSSRHNTTDITNFCSTTSPQRLHVRHPTSVLEYSSSTWNYIVTTILVKPPPDCETNDNILWKLNRQLYGLRDSPQKFQQHLSTILKQLGLRQLRSDQSFYNNTNITGLPSLRG